MMRGKRILVIGATGMPGKPVARHLRAEGFNVRGLARSVDRTRAALGEAPGAPQVTLKAWCAARAR
jgi:nucleoside-diphosphate-sugar epimerase